MVSGVIATSDPRGQPSGADVLASGGNAVDAAVAAALVLFVVEPHACGLGGDAFLMVSEPGRPVEALDGSGAVPAGMTPEALAGGWARRSYRCAVPGTVTVPGAVGLLDDGLARYGSLRISELAGPAADARRATASPSAAPWPRTALGRSRASGRIRSSGPVHAAGRPLQIDQQVTNPVLADLLEEISVDGAAAFYRGPIAEAIVARGTGTGGIPVARGHAQPPDGPGRLRSPPSSGASTAWELPPPTQGPAVLAALDWIEAADRHRLGPGPRGDPGGAAQRRDRHGQATGYAAAAAAPTDTTYLGVIDGEGRAASLITSVFADFGSHLGVDVLGGPIHNRATTFFAMGIAPRPGKPPHTTIPSLVTRDGNSSTRSGLAGGYVQAQVQVQLIVHLVEAGGWTPQQAVDAPRMRVLFGGDIALEPGHPLGAAVPGGSRSPDRVRTAMVRPRS